MNLIDTIDEIGIFETNIQLNKYIDNVELMYDISKYIPVSSDSSTLRSVNEVVITILNLRKKNIMFLSNEIAILEGMLKYKEYFDNIIVVLSSNLSKEQKEIIIKNSPNQDIIKYINELEYPTLIKPKNSVIVSFGYKNGNKCLLNKKSYRTLEIYKEFLGEKVFVSCLNESISERPKNWISINGEKYFTKML